MMRPAERAAISTPDAIPVGVQMYHPVYRRTRVVLEVRDNIVICQDTDDDGFQRIVHPFIVQFCRWKSGAVIQDESAARRAA